MSKKKKKSSSAKQASVPQPAQSNFTIPQALQYAIQLHGAGKLAEAEQIYRQVLAVDPKNSDALNLAGVAAYQAKNFAVAEELIKRAINFKPDNPSYYNNLGIVCKEQNKLKEAIYCYQQALQFKPSYAEANNNLAVIYNEQGKLEEAVIYYQQALKFNSNYVEAHYNLGITLRKQSKLVEAIASYQQALALNPNHAGIYYNLGIVLNEQNKTDEAISYYKKALKINLQHAESHHNLGNIYREQQNFEQAVLHYQQAIRLKPNFPQACNNLGYSYLLQNQLANAVTQFEQTLELQPDFVLAHNYLGLAFIRQGNDAKAVETLQQAITLKFDYAEAYANLGVAFQRQGHLDKAMDCLQRAINLEATSVDAPIYLGNVYVERAEFDKAHEYYQKAFENHSATALQLLLQTTLHWQNTGKLAQAKFAYQWILQTYPNHPDALHFLGIIANAEDDNDKAIELIQQAITQNPDIPSFHNNLGHCLWHQGRLTAAIESYHRALAIQPNYASAYNNLGIALKDTGNIDAAIDSYRKALKINSEEVTAHNNLLYTLNLSPAYSAQTIFAEHQRFYQQHAAKLTFEPPEIIKGKERPLKIGYVSGDFHRHSVMYFLQAILKYHDNTQFEIYCYHSGTKIDEISHWIQNTVQHWITCAYLSDEALATQIREDNIDILVDLAGHTAHNRLLMFARKPASVQISYLGYPNTTSLETMDYRIVDNYVDPKGQTEQFSSETLLRMPHSYFCYTPPENSPEVNELPALQNNYLTFGSFNNYAKLSEVTIQLWCQVLQAVPHSKLLIKARSLTDETVQTTLKSRFTAAGIDSERLILLGSIPKTQDHLQMYHQMDIGLDTYPYHGVTTTCEALWMGIPVVTLLGQTHVARVGLSLLTTVGLPELVANTEVDYVNICVQLAENKEKLQQLRSQLRNKMQTSPLMKGGLFTQHLEQHYRTSWQKWCEVL